jgi:dipeptidyl aminopeptidase/acylaminoacyl peptidase
LHEGNDVIEIARRWRLARRGLAVLITTACLCACRQAAAPPDEAASQPRRTEAVAEAPAAKRPAGNTAERAGLAPVVEIQEEDYALARSRFRTKLLRQGPAPQPSAPVQPPAGVTEVTFPSGELRLRAWVNRPAKEDHKRPAVLFLHGGFAFDLDDWTASQPYRDAGFVVLAPILRGENGQPGSFTFFYDEVDDVLAAAEFLAKEPSVDAKRLYVAGVSAGGTLSLLAAEANPRFRAAVSMSASPDQALLVKHAKIDLPFDKTNARELQVRSPLAYAASFKCPVRIYYATQDHFVLTSQRAADVAKARGLDVEAVRLEGDHGSIVPAAIKQSIGFFQSK